MPSKPGSNLLKVCIPSIDHHLAHAAPVLVRFIGDYLNLLVKNLFGQVLFGALAERLGFFWGVDAFKSNLVLGFTRIENSDGVAVAHSNDFSCDGGCLG